MSGAATCRRATRSCSTRWPLPCFAVFGAGKPNAIGTAIGALFVGLLLNGLTMMNAPYYAQDFIKGAVLVAALMFTFGLSVRQR